MIACRSQHLMFNSKLKLFSSEAESKAAQQLRVGGTK